MCFTNLVDLMLNGDIEEILKDIKELEDFDVLLGKLIEKLNEDDLVLITADHGNDQHGRAQIIQEN